MCIHLQEEEYNEVLDASKSLIDEFTRFNEWLLSGVEIGAEDKKKLEKLESVQRYAEGIIAHRIMASLFPKEYEKMQDICVEVLEKTKGE